MHRLGGAFEFDRLWQFDLEEIALQPLLRFRVHIIERF